MLRRATIAILACCLFFLCSPSLLSHPLDNWHLRFSLPGIYGFRGISHGGGQFAALGGESQIVTSPNGQDWLIAETPVTPFLRNITWGNGSFVAVGDAGTILTSTNATNWTLQSSGITTNLQYVEFGNGLFVAIGRSVVLTSTDGAAWSRQDALLNFYAENIAFGNGTFVLEYTPGTNLISTDGTNWSPCPSGSSNNLYCLDFGGGLFIAIDTRSKVFTSTDGSNWVQRGQVQITRPPQVAYGNNHFLVIGSGPLEYATLSQVGVSLDHLDICQFLQLHGGQCRVRQWQLLRHGLPQHLAIRSHCLP